MNMPVTSTGILKTAIGGQILDSCEMHFTAQGIQCTRPQTGQLQMQAMDCTVALLTEGESVGIRISTPNENYMVFIRDELVGHIATLDAVAVNQLCWSGGMNAGAPPANFYILKPVRRQEIFPGLIRVTLAGRDVALLGNDGIHIKLMMPAIRGQQPVWPVIGDNGAICWPAGENRLHARFVTVRHIRSDAGEIDVDIACHPGGLISDWARRCAEVQAVGVMGPGGEAVLPAVERAVLAADLTGLPALARLLESAEGRVSGHLFAAAPSAQALNAYLPASDLTVTAIAPAVFSRRVSEAIPALTGEAVGYGWFAGEYSIARELRAVFRQQWGLPKSHCHCTAYWRKGVAGHHP